MPTNRAAALAHGNRGRPTASKLTDGLQDRRLNARMLSETTSRGLVELVQVGNHYFIVDVHYRISVARHSEQTLVEADRDSPSSFREL